MTELAILSQLISFDSQSHKSNKEIVDYIVGLFASREKEFDFLEVKVTPIMKGDLEIFNLEVIFRGESSEAPIVFSGHTDTVPTSSKWTKDPFSAQLVDGRVYGLGSTDMKAGLTSMILTALSITEKPQQDIYFLFDADEEVVGTGGKEFVERLDIKNASIIVAEPTDCSLQVGQKGATDLQVKVFGQSFHSSKTNKEKNAQFNAVQKAVKIITALQALEDKLENMVDDLFGTPSQAVCKIVGGTAGNVIPDVCEFSISRRLLPSENMEEVLDEMIGIVNAVDPEAETSVLFRGEANLVDQESEFMSVCNKISQEVLGKAEIKVMSGWTQAGLFKKWGNCLIWGPGTLDMAHQADEYCELSQIALMTECYKEYINSR